MVPVWVRDAALDPADLVGQALGLVVRDKDRDRDLPEVVKADRAVLARKHCNVRAFDIRRGTADD
jgi:hypothetical protein